MQSLKIITIHKTAIDRFKLSWPCNGFPDNADLLVVAFDQNGGVLDYEFSDANDNIMSDMTWENTGALPALIDDAWASATATNIPDTISPFYDYR
tara:strand:+ start:8779 stop:9063 length:285 start_codon:yes stop_codon:yes gene_type:complete